MWEIISNIINAGGYIFVICVALAIIAALFQWVIMICKMIYKLFKKSVDDYSEKELADIGREAIESGRTLVIWGYVILGSIIVLFIFKFSGWI